MSVCFRQLSRDKLLALDVNAQDYGGWTPLHYLAHKGDTAGIQVLLDRGANPLKLDFIGWTPVHIACKRGEIEPVRLLLKYASPDIRGTQRSLTLFQLACEEGDIAMARFLLFRGASLRATDYAGRSALRLFLTMLSTKTYCWIRGQCVKFVN